jgi:hypothetical protein
MCSIASSFLRKVAFPPACNTITRRNLSVTGAQSASKLYDIFEEYRIKHFSEEYPKRFRKEIVKIAVSHKKVVLVVKPPPPSPPFVAVSAEGIEHVLENIGMGRRMSWSEIDSIVAEVGGDVTIPRDGKRHCVMSANQMFDLISAVKPTR